MLAAMDGLLNCSGEGALWGPRWRWSSDLSLLDLVIEFTLNPEFTLIIQHIELFKFYRTKSVICELHSGGLHSGGPGLG